MTDYFLRGGMNQEDRETLKRIEQKLDALIAALAEEEMQPDSRTTDLSGMTWQDRDETQPL